MTLVDANLNALFAITFHFVEQRLQYLAKVVAEIVSYPIDTTVEIYTNEAQDPRLRAAIAFADPKRCKIIPVSGLEHPYNLTWAHKPSIKDRFLNGREGFSHFVYLEDDEPLNFSAFLYFVFSRRLLRKHSLIPAFLRAEWNKTINCLTSTDNITHVDLTVRPFVSVNSLVFAVMDNPYWGGFVLDRELAEEYVSSDYYDIAASASLTRWDIRERAAMGLIYANAPSPFPSRYVVPLIAGAKQVLASAIIPHLPCNYANDAVSQHGKVPLATLFVGDFVDTNRVVVDE